MSQLPLLFESALSSDLTAWRAHLHAQRVAGLDVPVATFLEVMDEASAASLEEHAVGLKTLESASVLPYGGALEKALGAGVWTDGLHLWVAHSTVAELRRRALQDPDTTQTLSHALQAAAQTLRAVRQAADEDREPDRAPPVDGVRPFRAWSEVLAVLRATPEAQALVSGMPEAAWSDAEVRRFQRTPSPTNPHVGQVAAGMAAQPVAEQFSTLAPAGEGLPPISVPGTAVGGLLTDRVEALVAAGAPDALDHLATWAVQWHAPRLGAVARLANAMAALPEDVQEAYKDGPDPRRRAVLDAHGGAAYEAYWRAAAGTPPFHGAVLYDGGYPERQWARTNAALLDSTPQSENEDLARWYRAFLDRAWRSPEKQTAWSSLAPADPAWRGAAHWWEGSVKKEGFRFLVAQGQPVPETSQQGAGALPPLHRAVLSSDAAPIKKLLDRGAPVSAVDGKGETALFIALAGAPTQILLDAGADVNHRAKNGATALHAAFRKNEKRRTDPKTWKVAQLLAAGADPLITTRTGQTALHSLMASPHAPHGAGRLQILLDAGVDPLALDHKGRCAITLAWQQEPHPLSENWFPHWLSRPELSPGQFTFDQARALYDRLKAHAPGESDFPDPDEPTRAAQLEVWWVGQQHHHLESVMAGPKASRSPRSRM